MKNTCKSDGALISWGQVDEGGRDGTELREGLKGDVAEIFSTANAFAVIRASDGSLVTWGDDKFGGDSADVADQLRDNIQELHYNDLGFVAITKKEGRLVGWGCGFGSREFVVANECLAGDVRSLHLCDSVASLLVMRRSTGQIHVWEERERGVVYGTVTIDTCPTFYPSKAEWRALLDGKAEEVAEVQTLPRCFLVRTVDGKLFGFGRGDEVKVQCVTVLEESFAKCVSELEADTTFFKQIYSAIIILRNSDGTIYNKISDQHLLDAYVDPDGKILRQPSDFD